MKVPLSIHIILETAVGWFGFGENRRIIIGIMLDLPHPSVHPAGEQPPVEDKGPPQGVSLDTFGGPVHVEWDTEAALTPLGQLPFFIDFLKAAGLFDAFVADCPLHYTSRRRNATCWERRCCRCYLGTSAMLTSRRSVAITFFQSFSA
jgi:hypothetical protein